KRVQFPLKYLSIAAALLVALGTASYFLLWDRKLPPVALNANKQNLAQPQPGGDRAVLRLADGSIVILDSSDNGAVENNAGVAIQNKDGQLYYKSQENLNQTGAVAYHTLSTPRGGQYQIKLADGTQVWLNAASTLRFPAAFSGNTRDVVLTGEAYFEVAKDPSKVFSVQVGGVAIQVTGTHFNVNGYNDDGTIKTTLLEGGVQVTSPPYTQKLSPGEEANVTVKGIQVRSADKEEAIGWKEGVFVFHNTPASTVVNHLARWYNLDVEYNDEVRTHLNATIKRNASIHQVLRLLEGTGDIKFQLKDKKLIIMK
ncbi:MAG TPA: FecR domain-containing protein, partial [Flavisolibacter sp.]|nr:FecR domain-containing protein [Flavisolibacter sp.]